MPAKSHGMSYTVEYKTWQNIKKRCYYEKDEKYSGWGGRGIKMCDRWLESFENFYEDMGPKPSKNHSIERRDNDGNYCPENCYWATKKEQDNNKRTSKFIEFNGERLTQQQWSDRLGINRKTLFSRIARGWPLEKAFVPVEKMEI